MHDQNRLDSPDLMVDNGYRRERSARTTHAWFKPSIDVALAGRAGTITNRSTAAEKPNLVGPEVSWLFTMTRRRGHLRRYSV